MNDMKLTIELVPETAWYTNVRSNVSKDEWDRIRKACYRNANYTCEVCGGKGDKWPVECHEVWDYDDLNKKQTLVRLIALCPNCHKTKHVGLAQMKGEEDIVINQLMAVNDMTEQEATQYIKESFKTWRDRSKYKWDCDISYLDKYTSDEQELFNYNKQ
jgi:hypothetical protein